MHEETMTLDQAKQLRKALRALDGQEAALRNATDQTVIPVAGEYLNAYLNLKRAIEAAGL